MHADMTMRQVVLMCKVSTDQDQNAYAVTETCMTLSFEFWAACIALLNRAYCRASFTTACDHVCMHTNIMINDLDFRLDAMQRPRCLFASYELPE